ncbi:MAG: hypothetical protein EOM23_01475 [Candidatus Moranbacteria bacterium]|nr:hypothetical protein [Candidatus Moranbacteria bacterium]
MSKKGLTIFQIARGVADYYKNIEYGVKFLIESMGGDLSLLDSTTLTSAVELFEEGKNFSVTYEEPTYDKETYLYASAHNDWHGSWQTDRILRTPGKITINTVGESSDSAMISNVGGIDMNEIDIESSGTKIEFDFDPAMLQQFQEQNIQGFRPVTINFAPLPSILPLLGLDQSREPEIEVSRI